MRSNIRIDTRQLNRAAASLQRLTKESKTELVNESGKFIAINAYRGTKKTTAGAIREELNERRGPYTKAELIVAARARATGVWPTGKYGVRKASRKFITRQASSAGWLRGGFLPAIRTFGGRAAQAKRFRNFPGDATKARRSARRVVATIQHYDRGFVDQHPDLLQQAVNKQAIFLERLAQKKMEKAIRRAGR